MIAGRHRAYLEKLTRQLDRGDWDSALRNAVGLGQPDGMSPYRLGARRRTSLTPTLYRPTGGSVVLIDEVIRLRELYQRAMQQLEKEHRVTEAAFVLNDLLDDPAAAVALLERHERFRLAAELAEARDLHPDLLVRLWWRAGDRGRATDIARSRGNFAGAVDRLGEVDPAGGHRLREDWVHDRQRVGDVVGAVDAAWPESSLRRLVMADLDTSSTLDTPTAGYLFAHLVAEQPTEANLQRAMTLLDDPSPAARPVRSRFVDALATVSCEDPSADRRLSSAAMRSILRDSDALVGDAMHVERTAKTLRRRSDPLLRADLPPVPRHADETGIVEVEAPPEAGQLPVFDAAALSSGALLVAHGDLGVRLLTPDGRVRARWDVPTHGLVVADHGSQALLLSTAGGDRTIHVLDLVTRRVRRWTTLRVKSILPSYDGSVLATVTEDGLAFVDVLSDSPRITWRELDRDISVLAISRSSTDITALLNVPWGFDQRERRSQVRIWSQPGTVTRQLFIADLPPFTSSAIVASGRVVSIDAAGVLSETSETTSYRPIRTRVGDARLLSSGDAYAVITPSTNGMLVTARVRGRKVLTMAWPDQGPVGVRTHDGNLTFWDREGRLVAVATHPTPIVTANLRTHL
ncbi:MAG TPA: hypothetical protein VIP77_17130 [Jiangellaceae bacterium]